MTIKNTIENIRNLNLELPKEIFPSFVCATNNILKSLETQAKYPYAVGGNTVIWNLDKKTNNFLIVYYKTGSDEYIMEESGEGYNYTEVLDSEVLKKIVYTLHLNAKNKITCQDCIHKFKHQLEGKCSEEFTPNEKMLGL